MGNLIYTILTDRYYVETPENLNAEQTGRALMAGRRSTYPTRIGNSRSPAHRAVKEALDMCFTQEWRDRPSARAISNYLLGRLRDITGEERPDVRLVLPERDPQQGGSWSDFEKYNEA